MSVPDRVRPGKECFMTVQQTVLITGAAGRIGSMLRSRLRAPGRMLRLMDIAPLRPMPYSEEFMEASVTDMAAMQRASSGVDAVIHLGGEAGEAEWDRIRDINIQGTYTVFEAARREQVPRVIFASSNHAVGYHPREKTPAPDYLFPNPDTYYGVSKVACEALGSLYHNRYGLDVICIRILSCFERPADLRMLSTWLSPDDAGILFETCLTTPSPGYRVIWGVSANTRGWFSLREARALGYIPLNDAEEYAHELIEKYGEPDMALLEHRFVGGNFCSPTHDVD